MVMCGDTERLHLIHRLKDAFAVDDSVVSDLLKQVSADKRSYAERFFSGYTVEDRFGLLYGALPWMALLHGLEQSQIPLSSKEKYQVPDYLTLFEASSGKLVPFLVEVKHASGNKTTLEVMGKQYDALRSYATTVGMGWLLAIYWEKAMLWTLNAPDSLEEKASKRKISLEESLKNDLSVVFGDLTFMMPGLFRSTAFDMSTTDEARPSHVQYGVVVSDKAGPTEDRLVDIDPIESAVIDSCVTMTEIRASTQGSRTQLLEKAAGPHMLKLSTIIMHHLATFQAGITHDNALISRRIVVEFMKKIGVTRSFAVPTMRSSATDELYMSAFGDTWVWDSYLKAQRK